MDLPFEPGVLASDALDAMAEHLELTDPGSPRTHVALVALDIERGAVPAALGKYLVAVLAGGVEVDCQLAGEFFDDDPDAVGELRADLEDLLGTSNRFTTSEARRLRDRVRNPWIAEVLGHVLLVLHARDGGLCLPSRVVALKLPHIDPRRAGLDLLGVYVDAENLPGAVIGEVKASRRRGKARLRDAVRFYRGVDAGKRSTELRIELKALKPALPPDVRANFADGFWRERRTYLPVIAHSQTIDETVAHNGLRRLQPVRSGKRLVALRIDTFHGFFDEVAQAARTELAALVA